MPIANAFCLWVPSMVIIRQESPADAAGVEQLLDAGFGPDRLNKTAYRLREGVSSIADLDYVALDDGRLCATLRFWPVKIAGRTVLLLGPLAVDEACRGHGLGLRLMEQALERARQLGYRAVMLVGDLPYYAKVGFARAGDRLILPGPVDQARVLARELVPGGLDGVEGPVERWERAAAA